MQDTQHIFYEHLLQRHNASPLLKSANELIWPSVLLFVCLLLVVMVKVSAFPKLVRIVQSTFSPQVLQQLEREEINPFKFYSLALNLIFILNVAFLIYKINSLYKFVLVEASYFTQFCFFFGLVFVVFLLKMLLNKFLSLITDKRRVISDYTVSSVLVNQTFGLFLLPLIVLIEFSPFNPLIFIIGALAVLAAGFILKWYRGIIMGLVEERIGLLQIFSYFCGLEILPIFVLVKYIIETF